MPRGIDSLLILAFLSHTSSFRLSVDSRHVRTSENSDENSRRTGGGSEEFALFGRENVTHRRDNEETASLSGISENFINCTRIIDTLQAVENETQIREATVPIAKLKRLARAKRETIAHRDDTADNGEDVSVQTGEQESLPAEGNSQSEVPDDLENSNGAVEAGMEEEATPGGAEGDIGKEPDAELTDKEEPSEIEPDNENENNKVEEEASTDWDGGPQETGASGNEEDEDKNAQAGEDGKEEAVDVAGEEEAVHEAGEEEAVHEDGEAEAVAEDGEAEAVDEDGEAEAVDEDGEEEAVDEDGEEEAAEEEEDEADADYEAESEYEEPEEADISMETLIEWGMGLTVQDIWNFIVDVEKVISFTGDYILSILLRGLKRELRRTGLHDKFKAKLEELAASPDLDRPQATEKLMKEIRKQFGRDFEQKIVKFLKDLREGFKS